MNSQTKKVGLLPAIMLLAGLPIFFYATGDFPRRTLLKESISLLTIIGLCLILAQFFLTRSGKSLLFKSNMAKVIKVHKIIGYICLSMFFIHPFLIVLPRYFEAGVEPVASLVTILITYSNPGVLSGIFAWCLAIMLLCVAVFRKKILLTYKTWVAIHKWLSIAFILCASWHAIEIGRHTNEVLSAYIVFLALCGILLLSKDFKLPILLKSWISK